MIKRINDRMAESANRSGSTSTNELLYGRPTGEYSGGRTSQDTSVWGPETSDFKQAYENSVSRTTRGINRGAARQLKLEIPDNMAHTVSDSPAIVTGNPFENLSKIGSEGTASSTPYGKHYGRSEHVGSISAARSQGGQGHSDQQGNQQASTRLQSILSERRSSREGDGSGGRYGPQVGTLMKNVALPRFSGRRQTMTDQANQTSRLGQ